MSSDEGPGSEIDLTPHPLAPRLEETQDEAGEALATLVGFVGESRKDGHIRLYLDLSFTRYCEVATGDIVATSPLDHAEENSPTVVQLDGSAQVGLVEVTRVPAKEVTRGSGVGDDLWKSRELPSCFPQVPEVSIPFVDCPPRIPLHPEKSILWCGWRGI